jgi:STE24 endopeptidase
VNETKAARYHRARRRAGALSLAWGIAVLAAALWVRPELRPAVFLLAIGALHETIALPVAFYRTFLLDRRYELSTEPLSAWFKDHAKTLAIGAAFGVAAVEGLYLLAHWAPGWWWLAAAVAGTAVTVLLARVAPVLLLPLFYRFTPLDRPELVERLVALSRRANVPVLGVYEWTLGDKTRRANAALVGAGSTRRILLSDTLLAEYTDDEIEVILAHELAHHVHHDIPKGLALEFVVLLAAFGLASLALRTMAGSLGLAGPADVAGLPLLLLAAGAVSVVATPLLHACSRWNERRADRLALTLTGHHGPFISAMRRLSAQNLAEENPSRLVVWMFHSHPPVAERIASARDHSTRAAQASSWQDDGRGAEGLAQLADPLEGDHRR